MHELLHSIRILRPMLKSVSNAVRRLY